MTKKRAPEQKTDLKSMSFSEIVGAINILNIVFDTDAFIKWLNEYHPEFNITEIFQGYSFFLESAIATFSDTLHSDISLNINEDIVYHRATHFADREVAKLPCTCEKTALIKNIQKRLRGFRKAKTFKDLKKECEKFSNEILVYFFKIFEDFLIVISPLNYDAALRYSTMSVAQVHLSDLSKGVPLGYLLSPLKSQMTPKRLDDCFLGYKLGLEYLWFKLLGDQFEKSGLDKIHEATDWTYENDIPPWAIQDEHKDQKRTDLDSYFSIIQDNVMDSIEREWPSVKLNTVFSLKGKNAKKYLKPLFVCKETLNLTKPEQLKALLLWYDIELLDYSNNAIFNGIPAFLTLLAGIVEIKNTFANGERAIICKFTHPIGKNKNDYSYGVLIESHTWIADYSGWILCFDCCGDYSGFAGSNHTMAEMLIQEYKKRRSVTIREMTIEKGDFKELIKDNVTKGERKELLSTRLNLSNVIRKSQDYIADSQGIILEFLAYYTIVKRNWGEVDWNLRINKDQLDITCDTPDSFRLIECKVDPHNINLEKEFENLEKKLSGLKKAKEKHGQFWFYIRPNQIFYNKFKDLQKQFSKKGVIIDDYEVISDILNNDMIWRKKKLNKIKEMFDPNFLEMIFATNTHYGFGDSSTIVAADAVQPNSNENIYGTLL